MKAHVRSIVLILPLLLSSCVHKTNQALNQPALAPIEDAPLPKPDNAPANLPPPVISLPDHKDTTAPPPPPKPATPTPEPKHKKPSKTAPSQTPVPAPQTGDQASNSDSGVPAAGSLSSGGTADLKDQTQNMITDTEHTLNGINRKLNDSEAKTSAQIREFIKQARAALNTNDVEGAHGLAVKAKVLMSELSQ